MHSRSAAPEILPCMNTIVISAIPRAFCLDNAQEDLVHGDGVAIEISSS